MMNRRSFISGIMVLSLAPLRITDALGSAKVTIKALPEAVKHVRHSGLGDISDDKAKLTLYDITIRREQYLQNGHSPSSEDIHALAVTKGQQEYKVLMSSSQRIVISEHLSLSFRDSINLIQLPKNQKFVVNENHLIIPLKSDINLDSEGALSTNQIGITEGKINISAPQESEVLIIKL